MHLQKKQKHFNERVAMYMNMTEMASQQRTDGPQNIIKKTTD
jgi:hypothetical protein